MARLALALAAIAALLPQDGAGNLELRKQLKDEVSGDEWIYDDFAAATAAAKKDGRPIMAVFR